MAKLKPITETRVSDIFEEMMRGPKDMHYCIQELDGDRIVWTSPRFTLSQAKDIKQQLDLIYTDHRFEIVG